MSLSWPRQGSTWRGGGESWCENSIQVQILRVMLFCCCCLAAPSVGAGKLWGDIPRPTAKKKPQQDGRRGEIVFRIKPHTRQRCSDKPVQQGPEAPQRLRQNRVWVSPADTQGEQWVSNGLPQGQRLWVQQAWVWPKPSWRRSLLRVQLFCDPHGL